MAKKFLSVLLVGIMLCGCGTASTPMVSAEGTETESQQDTQETENPADSSNDDQTQEENYNEADTLKDYDTVDKLLDDASALVKVEVLQANSENVRNYIYTSYDMKMLDVVYGAIDSDGNVINVNMPGGTIQGYEAQEMLSEVTEGKDAGDLSGTNQIVSGGNTDRLLSVGDEAYLFLIRESENSFAVVGEYCGAMLLENGNVIFDSNITGFADGVSVDGLQSGSMTENEFLDAINDLIKDL